MRNFLKMIYFILQYNDRAGLCENCYGFIFMLAAHKCPECDTQDTNLSFARCAKCAKKTKKCSYCSKKLS